MTGFRASAAYAALLAGVLAAGAAEAQQDAGDAAGSGQETPPSDETGPATEAGSRGRQPAGPARAAPAPSDPGPAGAPPRSILPGPYLPEGVILPPDLAAPDTEPADSAGTGESGALEGPAELSGPVGVDSLDALSPTAVGAWTDSDPPALPIDMWRGSDSAILSALMPVLKVDLASPTLKSLARRLLLSPAHPPVTPTDAASQRADMAATPESENTDAADTDGSDTAFPGTPEDETSAETETETDTISRPRDQGGDEAQDGIAETADASQTESSDDTSTDPGAESSSPATPDPARVSSESLRQRLARLYAGGALDDFLALAEQSPDRVLDAATRRLQASALMLVGDYDAGCRIAGDAVGASGSDFWQRAMVICAAFDGNRPQVYFRLELLAESGAVEPAFEAMALALLREIEGSAQSGAPAIPDLPERLDALDFTLARLSRTPVPAELAASVAPAVLSAALDLPDYSPAGRLALIATGLEHGLVDETALAAALAALAAMADDAPADDAAAPESGPSPGQGDIDTPTDEQADALAAPSGPVETPDTDPRVETLKRLGRAYRAALDAQEPRAVLDALEDAYAAGRTLGHPVIAARMLAGPLGRVSPAPALADRAHVAGRILILSGRISAAGRWFDIAREAAEAGNPAAEEAMLTLWPLLALADPDSAGDRPAMADQWWRAQSGDAPAMRQAASLAALLQAFDGDTPAVLQQAALAAAPGDAVTPSAALWRQLLLAIHAGRTGETLLTALAGLRNGELAHTAESYLAAVIAGLRRAGLTADARALALERLAHRGF